MHFQSDVFLHSKYAVFAEDATPFFHVDGTTMSTKTVRKFGVFYENEWLLRTTNNMNGASEWIEDSLVDESGDELPTPVRT